MAGSQIVIKISSTDTGSGVTANQEQITGGVVQPSENETSKKPNKAGETSKWKDIAKTIIVDQGRRVLNESINQFVDLTGSAKIRGQVNAFNTALGYGTAIAAGGVVGAVAVAVDIGLKAATSEIEIRKANAQVELLRQRVGNSLVNGGRGTYD